MKHYLYTLVRCGFIPFCFVVCAVLMEVILFVFLKLSFPKYYFASVLLLASVAVAVSCIPNRPIQITILGVLLLVQFFTSVTGIIAQRNLNEFFNLETLKATKEVFSSSESQKYNVVPAGFALGFWLILFFAASITISVLLRKQKAGYRLKSLVAVTAAAFIAFGSLFIHVEALRKPLKDNLSRLLDPYYSFANFTNRSLAFMSFGSPVYFTANLFHLMGANNMAGDKHIAGIDLGWHDVPEYQFKLDANSNLIFIMMETGEFDGINVDLMPNLTKVQKMSTSIDGYYSIERTVLPSM